MDNLNSLAVFARVAETRSFTAAARRLGLTASAVSKAVSRLEQELGVRLLHRSTRVVSLTNDGAVFYDRCRQILDEIDDAENVVRRSRIAPHGRLRVQMPVGFGRRVVVPQLVHFIEQYPELIVDAELSDRIIDLAYEGLDMAIQIGAVTDERLVAHRICTLRFAAYASPGYLERHGEPQTPDDLARHRCMAYLLPMSAQYRGWQFTGADGQVFTRTISGSLNLNNAESLLEAAVAGAGIVMISNFIAADALRAGLLRRILTGYLADGPPVHVVYLPSRSPSPKVRAFCDFLAGVVAGIEDT